MYPFVAATMGEVEGQQVDSSENDETLPQSKRPCRREIIENVHPTFNSLAGESRSVAESTEDGEYSLIEQ